MILNSKLNINREHKNSKNYLFQKNRLKMQNYINPILSKMIAVHG